MAAWFNHAGTFKLPKSMWVRIGVTWTAVERFYLRHAGIWQLHYQNEIIVTLSSRSTYLGLQSLFTADDWASSKLKRVVIPAGAELGTNTSFAVAVNATSNAQADSFGGALIIENYGTISGIGGAPNSGAGGDAIYANVLGRAGQKLIVNNYSGAIIRAGGGGGGKGGNGGAGTYDVTVRQPTGGQYNVSGQNGGPPNYMVYSPQTGDPVTWTKLWYWNSSTPLIETPYSATSVTIGSTTYHQGTNFIAGNYWGIYRTYPQATPTAGGVAGDAGRGQGFDGAATAGAASIPGGTNAGASGKSGDGGAWGTSGQDGSNGASGNVGLGTAGVAGGVSGAYLNGSSRATLNSQGTLLGRLI